MNLETWDHHFIFSSTSTHLEVAQCLAEHCVPVAGSRWGLQTLLPLAFGIKAARENTTQSSTRENNALLR